MLESNDRRLLLFNPIKLVTINKAKMPINEKRHQQTFRSPLLVSCNYLEWRRKSHLPNRKTLLNSDQFGGTCSRTVKQKAQKKAEQLAKQAALTSIQKLNSVNKQNQDTGNSDIKGIEA